jgi:tetratricopeptide (TPR) repeat protein
MQRNCQLARFDKLEFDEGDSLDPEKTSELSLQSDSSETHWLKMADTNRREGKYENALRFYSRALEIDKTILTAWVGQVQMLVFLEEYPQAITWSKKALELFPNHADLIAAQSQAECRRGDLKQSNQLIDGAMKVRGESAYQWQVRGELMIALKQRTDRHCFDKAQVTSSDSLIPLESALIYLHYQEYAKGAQRAAIAAEKSPELYFAWFVLGQCQEGVGLDQAAVRSYKQCCDLCQNHQQAKQRIAALESGNWNPLRSLGKLFRRK